MPKDILSKARLAYTHKRLKVLKEITDSEANSTLTDTRIEIMYQYTQKFLRFNEIMEFAERQKQSNMAQNTLSYSDNRAKPEQTMHSQRQRETHNYEGKYK